MRLTDSDNVGYTGSDKVRNTQGDKDAIDACGRSLQISYCVKGQCTQAGAKGNQYN